VREATSGQAPRVGDKLLGRKEVMSWTTVGTNLRFSF
jgi:hypothetical protein